MPTIISIADFFVSAHGGPHKEASGLPYASPPASFWEPGSTADIQNMNNRCTQHGEASLSDAG